MRPYLAVIIDSFHAALSSRILWVAFLGIWLLLGALAPIGFREDYTTTFRGRDIRNGTQMKAMLARGLVDPEQAESAIGRIATAMPDDLRRQLRRVGEGEEVRIWLSTLADALNEKLDDESWYDDTAWRSTVRLKELRDLDATDDADLSESLRRRRARLRIEAAMPGVFEARSARSVILKYAGMDFPANIAIDKTQFISLINQWVVPTIINWLLGFILVFLGILVTAHIIPDMLEPGSLHLLLSKPVSRTLLFLSKFVGGCAFVFLCVIQLVVGLYLIAGLRLDVWNIRVLWCIPVSVFLFSVFYSVSAVAGLRWRSPILAIGVTCIFGMICFVIGFIGELFDGFVTRPHAIQHLVVVDDTPIAATRGGGLVRLDRQQNRWVEIVDSDAMTRDRVLAPILLDEQRVVTAIVGGGRFNPFGSGPLDLLVLSESSQWQPEPCIRLPTATSSLYRVGNDAVLAMNAGGLAITDQRTILEAAGEKPASGEEGEGEGEKEGEQEAGKWLAKLTHMMGGATSGFSSILPARMTIAPPRALVVGDDGRWLVLLSRGRLTRLQKPGVEVDERPAPNSDEDPSQGADAAQDEDDGGVWTLEAETRLSGEPSDETVLAVSGPLVMVSRADEPIQFFDVGRLDPVASVDLSSSLVPVSGRGLGDGRRFALLTSDGRCRIVSVDEGKVASISDPLGFREVESIHFDSRRRSLIIIHHIDRLVELDAETMKIKDSVLPALSRWRLVERYAITPLRTLTPQTGELGETIAAMVSGKSAVRIDDGAEQMELVRYDVMRPLLSCGLFVTFMLVIGCVYFSRRDF